MSDFDDKIRKQSRDFFEAELRDHGEVMPASGQRDGILIELLQQLLPENGRVRFLDVGCGLGYVANTAKALTPHAEVFGVDLSEQVVTRARELDTARSVSFEIADELHLPYEDASLDVAVCRFSIHHYPDVPAHLLEIRRVLKPGGVYLVIDSIPDPGKHEEQLNELFIKVERQTTGHVKFYTLAEYEAFAVAAGFRVEKTKPFDLRLELGTERPHHAAILAMPPEFRQRMVFEERAESFSITMRAAGIYLRTSGGLP